VEECYIIKLWLFMCVLVYNSPPDMSCFSCKILEKCPPFLWWIYGNPEPLPALHYNVCKNKIANVSVLCIRMLIKKLNQKFCMHCLINVKQLFQSIIHSMIWHMKYITLTVFSTFAVGGDGQLHAPAAVPQRREVLDPIKGCVVLTASGLVAHIGYV
jgi:hypothetical protein